jgi:hypothetical protein
MMAMRLLSISAAIAAMVAASWLRLPERLAELLSRSDPFLYLHFAAVWAGFGVESLFDI